MKRRINLRKHGLDFADAEFVLCGEIVTVEDDRQNYGEIRFITIGRLLGRVIVVIHTAVEDTVRIISMRKATNYETRIYFQQVGN